MRSFLTWMACLWFVTGAFAQSTADAEQCANAGDSGDDTIAACTRAIKSGQLSSVNLAVTFYNRGNTWGRKGDNESALADYNETIRLIPQYALAYHNRGNTWGRKGDNDRALADYDEAIRLNPK